MKNLFKLVLICLLGLSLSSCGSKDNEAGDNISPPATGNGNGLGDGGTIGPSDRVDVNLSDVVAWGYRDRYESHIDSSTTYVRPIVNTNSGRIRTINMNDSRWTSM